jgi:hypothetical protein
VEVLVSSVTRLRLRHELCQVLFQRSHTLLQLAHFFARLVLRMDFQAKPQQICERVRTGSVERPLHADACTVGTYLDIVLNASQTIDGVAADLGHLVDRILGSAATSERVASRESMNRPGGMLRPD